MYVCMYVCVYPPTPSGSERRVRCCLSPSLFPPPWAQKAGWKCVRPPPASWGRATAPRRAQIARRWRDLFKIASRCQLDLKRRSLGSNLAEIGPNLVPSWSLKLAFRVGGVTFASISAICILRRPRSPRAEHLGPILADLGATLGQSWPLLGRSGLRLGRSGAHLGPTLAPPGPILGPSRV